MTGKSMWPILILLFCCGATAQTVPTMLLECRGCPGHMHESLAHNYALADGQEILVADLYFGLLTRWRVYLASNQVQSTPSSSDRATIQSFGFRVEMEPLSAEQESAWLDLLGAYSSLKSNNFNEPAPPGFGSAYDVIGCGSCGHGLVRELIGARPLIWMVRDSVSRLGVSLGLVSMPLDITIIVVFDDGSTMKVKRVDGIWESDMESGVDSEDNPIPHRPSDTAGQQYRFYTGYAYSRMIQRLRALGREPENAGGIVVGIVTLRPLRIQCDDEECEEFPPDEDGN